MENASKALIMAGTVLLSLVIISALVFSFNRLTDYQKTTRKLESEEQVLKFNQSYQSFEKDLYGSELLSLVNKAIDYNEKNTPEGYLPITISIKLKNKVGNVNAGTHSIIDENNVFATNLLVDIDRIKLKYKGDKYLQRLINLHYTGGRDEEINELLKDIGLGENAYNSDAKDDIEKYGSYVEFKRKKFEWKETLMDGEQPGAHKSTTNGRIVQMEFEEIV